MSLLQNPWGETNCGNCALMLVFVANAEVASQPSEAWICSPEGQSPNHRGRQEMDIDPTRSAPMQTSFAHERNDVTVRNEFNVVHALVGSQEFDAASPVADEELAIDQLVPSHFIQSQQPIHLRGVGCPVCQESNPNGRVDKNHQAT